MATADRVIYLLQYSNSFFECESGFQGIIPLRRRATKKVKEHKMAPEEVDYSRARPRERNKFGANLIAE